MELAQLSYFIKVAELEHVTRAAEELHMAQPALTKAIRQLEKELNTPLFDRLGKYIRLNENGRIFLKYATEALQLLEEGKKQLQDTTDGKKGSVQLAIDVHTQDVPELIMKFKENFPEFNVAIVPYVEGSYHHDLCLTSMPILPQTMERVCLYNEELLLALPDSHPLASLETIHLQAVRHESFIMAPASSSLRVITDRCFAMAGIQPSIALESEDPILVERMVAAGQLLAIVPSKSWTSSAYSGIVLRRIVNAGSSRTVSLCWMKGHYLSCAAERFKELAIQYYKEKPTVSV
ncbi:LysR family transcriptional regulator [Paenibacillus gallinarum]|uniref:LysR family transcriptional regulator n=1 Tax=Paenibacillus gallinarum TaxID=2762232 RepID=A0ABR8SY52_9BACL|nr:LysR family transcriptional regulator [Paenibacillus gallinarum]MBD7968352.1 LysR family transcriptional regulator [Paenibacillus gallinarum]